MRRKECVARSVVTVLREVKIEEDGNLCPIQHPKDAVFLTAKWDDLLPMYIFASLYPCSKLNPLTRESQLPSRERQVVFSSS
jgi:hypothetical protein